MGPLNPGPSQSGALHHHLHPDKGYLREPHSPPPSIHSEASLEGEEELGDFEFSEDERVSLEKPMYFGLFCPNLFKTLLFKAKTTANMGRMESLADYPMEPKDPCASLFTEQVTAQEVIPSPKFFVDVIKRQWDQPGFIPAPSGMDKRMYTAEQELEELLQILAVDVPLATLASAAILPSDTAERLRAEDRKAELSACKTHQAAAWAINSFFSRTSLLWLSQMLARTSPEDTCLQQDISKLIAAAEYLADATLNAAKFASRALASNVTSNVRR